MGRFEPVTAPRSCELASPKLTFTLRIAAVLFVAGVTVKLNVTGLPAVSVPVVAGTMLTVGIGLTATVTVAETWLDVLPPPVVGGVVPPPVPPPPADGGVVVVPFTPAVAVTVAGT